MHQAGSLDEAAAIYQKILKRERYHFDALNLLGVVRYQQGRAREALPLLEAALKKNPQSAAALNHYGLALRAIGRREDALIAFGKSLALQPNLTDSQVNRVRLLLELSRFNEALAGSEAVLAREPHHAEAMLQAGAASQGLGRHLDAVAIFDRLLEARPNEPIIHYNRAIALDSLGRHNEALQGYDRAIALNPNFVGALYNRGDLLDRIGRWPQAIESLEQALAKEPDHPRVHVDLCKLLLSLGRFAQGYQLFERRWSAREHPVMPRPYQQQVWDGRRLDGMLLVWGEQGLGDQILYAGMIDELRMLAARIVLEVEPRLVPLFARSFPGIHVIAAGNVPYDRPIDAQIALGSLCQYLRADWSAFPRRSVGYLVADATRTAALRERIKGDAGRVVGLSWISKNPVHAAAKSATLRDFEMLLRLPNTRFVDLQYGDTTAERTAAERDLGVRVEHLDHVDTTNDIDTLAALIAACDAVVTVSNTTAHLAGALGRPTWIMVPHGRAHLWYWFKEGARSPWYPQVRVRRQQRGQTWTQLLNSCLDEIASAVQMPSAV